MARNLLIATISLCVLTLFSCKKEKDEAENVSSAGYFPLSNGRYVVYEVDSVVYDDFACDTTTSKMQMRYMVADSFMDNQGRLSYRIRVSRRSTQADLWSDDDVLYATQTHDRLELVQNNLRFIKLVSPVVDGRSWNGNSMIPTSNQDYSYFAGWKYEYSRRGQMYNNGLKSFDNTVTVSQIDERQNDPALMPSAFAMRIFGKEVYARNIGMVYREMTYWVYDPKGQASGCTKGYSVIMKAVDHN